MLSAHQASILDHLDAVEPMSLNDLAAHMGVTPSTMSLNIDRLERGGYVIRERADDDRRRLQLRLTDAGERMKAAGSVLDPRRVALLLGQLSSNERRDALAGLELLAAAAERTMQKYGRGPRGAGRGRGADDNSDADSARRAS